MPSIAFFSDSCVRAPRIRMVDFLGHWARGRANERWIRTSIARARSEAARGTDPTAISRTLFAMLRGTTPTDIAAAGAAWIRDGGRITVAPGVRERIRAHRANGDVVVFVASAIQDCLAGSAPLLLGPEGGVDAVLGSVPVVEHEVLTGEVPVPMIGAARAEAVRRFCALGATVPAACYAYGRASTDAPMLAAVGHRPGLRGRSRRDVPVVVVAGD